MASPNAFDATMLACHALSCIQQALFFSGLGVLSAADGLKFECALLLIKSIAEAALRAFTLDLVAHHVGFALAAFGGLVAFPSHASSVLFVNIIHIPLAINYARKIRAARRGGRLDTAFGHLWFGVCGARLGMAATQSVRTSALQLPVRWAFYSSVLALGVLDFQWTREAFRKRALPLSWPLLLLGGGVLGAHFESRAAKTAWCCASATALLLVVEALIFASTPPWRRR